MISIANCLGRLACGRVADVVVERGVSRASLVVAADACGAAAMLLFYASGASVGAALAGAAVVGFAYGMVWTLIPTVAADLFGRRYFGSNYALCLPSVVAGSVLFSTILAPTVYAAGVSVSPAFSRRTIDFSCFRGDAKRASSQVRGALRRGRRRRRRLLGQRMLRRDIFADGGRLLRRRALGRGPRRADAVLVRAARRRGRGERLRRA